MKRLITILATIFLITGVKAQCPITITPSPTTICAGTNVTLTASAATSYTWSANAGSVNTAAVTVSPVVNTTYTVTATTGTCVATQTVAVTVNPLPTVTVNSPSICVGSVATLTAGGASTYTWSTGAIGSTTTVSPGATTSYTVTGTSPFGCKNTAVSNVTVNPLPNVTVNSPTVCAGFTVTLTAAGASTYTWNTAATGVSIIVAPTSTTNYTVNGTNAQGCTNSAVSTVTVIPSPTVTVNSTIICSGATPTLTANGAVTYTWSANAGSATTNTVQITPSVTTIYTVTGTNALGCTDAATSTVTVNSSSLTITPPVGTTTLYCTGVPYQFGAVDTTNYGSSVLFYTWSATPSAGVIITNGVGATANGPNFTFPTVGFYTLTLIVQLSSGCLDSAKYALSVVQTPTVQTAPGIAIVCQGGPGTVLYATGAGSLGTYTWTNIADIINVYAAGDSVLVNPPNVGAITYTVVGTNAGGCNSLPVVMTVTVNAPPIITAYALNDTICAYMNTGVDMLSSYNIAGTTYTWTCGNNGNLGSPFSHNSAVSPIYSGNVDTTFSYFGNVTVPGCPASAFPTYTVNVVVIPTPTVYVTSDTAENCNKKGDSLHVTSNPPTGVTFTWTPSYGLSATTGSGVYATPNYSVTYYVTPEIILSNITCIGKRDSIKVFVGDSTNASISPLYHIMCRGDTNMLVGLPAHTQLNSTYQYYWQPSFTPPIVSYSLFSPFTDTAYISPLSTTIFTLTVRGTCVKKKTATMTIAVNACITPVVTYSATADTICVKHCVYYTDLTQNNYQKPLFYMWVFTGVSQGTGGYIAPCPRCIIHQDTVWYTAADSLPIPKIKVCYWTNSSLNTGGTFPVQETVWDGVPHAGNSVTTIGAIKVDEGPQSFAGNDVTINLGDNTILNGLGSSGNFAITTYDWSPPTALSCTNCPNPVANPSVTTQYILTVIDKNGCPSTDSVTVYVDLKCFDPFIPTAFSPNGDKYNDVLYVHSNCLTNFTFKIFDRWGEKVFETSDMNVGWDGSFRNEPLNAGVFVYTFEGYLSTNKEVKKHGSITLVK